MITDTSKKYSVQFDTSDSAVATISKDGIVKAKKAGNAGIIVRNEGGEFSTGSYCEGAPIHQ